MSQFTPCLTQGLEGTKFGIKNPILRSVLLSIVQIFLLKFHLLIIFHLNHSIIKGRKRKKIQFIAGLKHGRTKWELGVRKTVDFGGKLDFSDGEKTDFSSASLPKTTKNLIFGASFPFSINPRLLNHNIPTQEIPIFDSNCLIHFLHIKISAIKELFQSQFSCGKSHLGEAFPILFSGVLFNNNSCLKCDLFVIFREFLLVKNPFCVLSFEEIIPGKKKKLDFPGISL